MYTQGIFNGHANETDRECPAVPGPWVAPRLHKQEGIKSSIPNRLTFVTRVHLPSARQYAAPPSWWRDSWHTGSAAWRQPGRSRWALQLWRRTPSCFQAVERRAESKAARGQYGELTQAAGYHIIQNSPENKEYENHLHLPRKFPPQIRHWRAGHSRNVDT